MPVDISAEMRQAADFLSAPARSGAPAASKRAARTSDLSIDEEIALHAIGWEPMQLVCGATLYSIPMGVWNWGQGEITYASNAYAQAFAGASDHLHQECTKVGGRGVVGVHVTAEVHRHHVDVVAGGDGGASRRIRPGCPPSRCSCRTSRDATSRSS